MPLSINHTIEKNNSQSRSTKRTNEDKSHDALRTTFGNCNSNSPVEPVCSTNREEVEHDAQDDAGGVMRADLRAVVDAAVEAVPVVLLQVTKDVFKHDV